MPGGFTLIEVMITVAIVAILAAIALPAYGDYILRGRLVDATSALAAQRAKLEQYYQDNRTYATVSATILGPCDTTNTATTWTVKTFTLTCSGVSATAYALTMTGSGSTNGFAFTVNQANTQTTVLTSSTWGSGTYNCWIGRKADSCS